MNLDQERKKRSKIFYGILIPCCIAVTIYLLWSLQDIIIPTIVGALLAYVCLPIIGRLKQKGVPDSMALLLFFALFVGGIMALTTQLQQIIPDEDGKLILKIRIQYKLNEKYQALVGANADIIPEAIQSELNEMVHTMNQFISLNPKERERFESYYADRREFSSPDLERYYGYYAKNLLLVKKKLQTGVQAQKPEGNGRDTEKVVTGSPSLISKIIAVISVWLVAPFVFLFLLVDDGAIKRSLISLVPNRFFEMVLTMVNNVDEAIGNYLRGTLLECALVGVSFIVGLFLMGIEFQWALIIGIIGGAAAAIHFLGPIVALVVSVFYVLISENINPILPFISANDSVIWVLIVNGIAQGLDNVIFQPIVLGSAVSLHPLVVIFGVIGGSIMYGFTGMLFAIPVIVIVKVVLETMITELKAYHLIE